MRKNCRVTCGLLTAALMVLPSLVEGAQQPPPLPPIREFDIATVERLGRAIYEQDQFAWMASDVAVAKRGGGQILERDGLRGWITERRDGKDVVRFIRLGADGPEALYDVTFAQGAEPVFTTPTDRKLSESELGQYNARMLALASIPRACTDRRNSVALKDPEGDGWLVWALASTTDPDLIVLRGHYRFTISADGKTIRAIDALSASCDQISRKKRAKDMPPDAEPAGLLSSDIVSLTPAETYVFASLSYDVLIHVGTEDGNTWRVDGDHVSAVDQGAPGEDGSTARFMAGEREVCGLITSKLNETPKRYYVANGATHVISITETAEKYPALAEPGFKAEALACTRQDIVPSPNDYKVLAAGLSLNILDKGAGHPERSGTLELVDGKARFNVKGAPLTDDLPVRVNARLEAFQKALQAVR